MQFISGSAERGIAPNTFSLRHSRAVNGLQSQTSEAPVTRLSSNIHNDYYCMFITTQLPHCRINSK